jgi:hypothetical protein
MNKKLKQTLFWIPRILSILYALFLSLFALDVFNEGYNIRDTIIALLIHLVPTYLVVIALFIAWQREHIGGALFIALAMIYLIISRGESWIISVPFLLIGVLFLFNWTHRTQHKTQY